MQVRQARMLSALGTAILLLLAICLIAPTAFAADAAPRRKVIIDQDAFGPAGSNLQAILMLLQSRDVEVLGITIPSGDGWRDEEVSHTLRLLEIAHRTEVPVVPGAMFPLVNTPARTKIWEALYGKLFYKGAWTETWPDKGAVRRSPFHADPFLVPPSPAGEPKIRPAADNAFAAEYVNAPRREFNMRFDPEATSIVLHEPWKKITEVPIDPTTRTFFKPEYIQEVARGQAPFDAYLGQFGQSFPMWDELAVAVWLDPSLITRRATLAVDVDVDTSFTAGYGNTLSWAAGEGPGLGERPVEVVLDVDVPRFERFALNLLSAPTPPH
jgi:purine nucleosidase